MLSRMEKITGNEDLSHFNIIEIGALDSPVFTRPEYQVQYIDYASTDSLRKNHVNNPFVSEDKIVDVDYVWSPGLGELSDCVVGEVDFVFASHVIEHVPDLVTWFRQIAGIIKTGGKFVLIVPDMNKTFDCLRPLTNTAEVIDAYVRKVTRPTYKHIFEYYADHAADKNGGLFADGNHKDARRVHSLQQSFEKVMESFENNSYIDAHCWVLTPGSLLKNFADLVELGLFDFKINNVYMTEDMEIDFIISLEKIDVKNDISAKALQINSFSDAMNMLDIQKRKATGKLSVCKSGIRHKFINLAKYILRKK